MIKLILLASLSLWFLVKFLWKKNSHNSIFWGLCFQWLAINIKLAYSIVLGTPLVEIVEFPEYISEANAYSNIGLVTLIMGVHLSIKKIKYVPIKSISWVSIKSINNVYIIYSVLIYFLVPFTYKSGFQQILNYLVLIKFSLLFVALNQTLSNKRKSYLAYFIIAFEILLSFTGYFAEFKNYFFVIIFTLIYHYSSNINLKIILKLSPLLALVLYLGIAWSSIKMDYRSYLSNEDEIKKEEISTLESLTKLKDLMTDFSEREMNEGLKKLIDRISYIDYYSATINNVPTFEAHTNGKLLLDALIFGLQPRILFPNKAVTDDSKVTEKYTGIYVSGKESGTSISLGYMASGYIDFGATFFWATPLIIGLLLGYSYKLLYKFTSNPIWSLAITFPYFQIANFYENDTLKVVPPILYFLFICILFLKYILPFFDRKISSKRY